MVDVDTGVTNSQDATLPPGYIFNGVSSGASGFTLTPSFRSYILGYSTTTSYSTLAKSGSITSQGQTITDNFTLPVSSVSGTVYLYDGVTPVPNVYVQGSEVINGSTGYVSSETDANGNYQLVGALTGRSQPDRCRSEWCSRLHFCYVADGHRHSVRREYQARCRRYCHGHRLRREQQHRLRPGSRHHQLRRQQWH